MVSIFIGAIAERYCGLDLWFLEVSAFYVDFIMLVYRRVRRSGRTKIALKLL